MSEKAPSKDEALEALDFIVNVLKEHEKDLDKLVNELGTVASQLGESGELNGKVKKIEDKINVLQSEVSNLIKSLAATPRESFSLAQEPEARETPKLEDKLSGPVGGMPLIVRCKDWADFLAIAARAQAVSFNFKQAEKILEVEALKNNRVVTFSGGVPEFSPILKVYLSKQLDVPEKQILEGNISLG